jgi:hypothetical protein
MTQEFFNRSFQMWEYDVSHQQLLLRSPKADDHPTNVDVAFVGVNYINLPTFIAQLSIVEPDESEIQFSHRFIRGDYIPKVYVLKSQESRYLVIAATMKVFENTLDIFESSLESFRIKKHS